MPGQASAAGFGLIWAIVGSVGGGVTIHAEQAASIAERLGARWIVPMHYRTERVNFLEPIDAFVEQMTNVEHIAGPRFDTDALPEEKPLAVVPAAP